MTEDKKKHADEMPEKGANENSSNPNHSPKGEKGQQPAMVALTMQEYDDLQKSLEEANQKAQTNFDGWQRERADFINYKKRIDKDQNLVRTNIQTDVILKYLILQDDLERALKSLPDDLRGSSWVEGIEHIYHKLLSTLENEGIKKITPDGEMFDPTIHEAVVQEENPDHQSGQIIEVISPGYQIGDRIIRPARVKVAR
jgi:molecular chaperone GrpE